MWEERVHIYGISGVHNNLSMLIDVLRAIVNKLWEMLTSALRVLVNNPFKESFYGKWKKKVINILIAFFIFYKNDIKIFLKMNY